ncbi:NAD-dependent DNA ligase LigA [Stieleria sp. JC731]|uniref:NAD-dependent DNA ligase LigA n=1 Tax=Pirellulaceae TaxID=2691357 RepID=UPI001E651B01|nr:NAD-dependent DNA ligase LigA [Stieleria sp. JC731]MCC9603481.1 NAD-dependent DNA ligase LigA [Stieleria sp. JC731]
MADPAKRVDELRDEIRKHDNAYYVLAQPTITDLAYDQLLDELRQLEQQHPQLLTADSPTQRIGDEPVPHLEQVEHSVPMLSIDNTYSIEELQAYFERTEKLLEGQAIGWVMEYKIDGVAASIRYEDGQLTRGLTRGNGAVGDDITHNIRTIRDLPLRTSGDTAPAVLEVRGEVYMTNEDLSELNNRQVASGGEPYKNTRNVTAGTIRLLDPAIAAQRNLRFFCHGVGQVEGLRATNHMEFLREVASYGIPMTPDVKEFKHWKDALSAVQKLEEAMPDLAFEIDGIVFKVNDFAQRDELGMRSKSPRWLIAYKFERYEATTVLEKITVQVGKTGAITPVAHLKPVNIADTTVSRASLHNADEIERLDVRVGDVVVVEKAGKIIPKVVRVEKHERSKTLRKFKFPDQCPECSTELVRDEGGVYIRCPNPQCPAQLKQRLIYFGSRTGMDIDGLGEEVVDLLLSHELVSSYADLYRLQVEQLSELEWKKQRKGKDGKLVEVKFGKRNAENLVKGIEKSRQRGLARVLSSISIRHVGPRVAKLITAKYPTIESLQAASTEDLAAIHEIGERIAESLHEFLHDDYGQQIIQQFADVEVKLFDDVEVSESGNRPLDGKTLVVTGTLNHYKRDEIKKLIEQLGGRASGSVSKNTDYLVAGEKAGSKLDKANQLGVKVLSEDEFRQLAEGE